MGGYDILLNWLPTILSNNNLFPRKNFSRSSGFFFNHKKVTINGTNRFSMFLWPIDLVKHIIPIGENKGYKRVHVSFQSNSSTNINTVNYLDTNKIFVANKDSERDKNNRKQGIKMNHRQNIYWKIYGKINKMHKIIKHCNLYYWCWKYWSL